ncbi:MAG TPA: hypothetical protein VFT70_03390 [Nocardioides sp.]|nr:hypothetical protein [Nocardioides sp.]
MACGSAPPTPRRAHHPDLPPELDDLTHDELRAIAFGWLARPDDIRELLAAGTDTDQADVRPGVRRKPHHAAVVYLHLHESAIAGTADAVARAEHLGPMLLDQVVRLLGHAHVTLKPVLDLDERTSVNASEFPEQVSERTRLRCHGDAFPHATNADTITGRYDNDHPIPYDGTGPPGQTGDRNNALLARYHHRAKTHRGYRPRHLGHGEYLWITPHGLRRLVTPAGTFDRCPTDAYRLEHADELDAMIDRACNESITDRP